MRTTQLTVKDFELLTQTARDMTMEAYRKNDRESARQHRQSFSELSRVLRSIRG